MYTSLASSSSQVSVVFAFESSIDELAKVLSILSSTHAFHIQCIIHTRILINVVLLLLHTHGPSYRINKNYDWHFQNGVYNFGFCLFQNGIKHFIVTQSQNDDLFSFAFAIDS